MHAAKPAAAIEQATTELSSGKSTRMSNGIRPTSNFRLATTFRSRNRTSAFKQHPDRLRAHQVPIPPVQRGTYSSCQQEGCDGLLGIITDKLEDTESEESSWAIQGNRDTSMMYFNTLGITPGG